MVFLFLFSSVQNHQNQVGRLGDRDYLTTATTAVSSSFDDTGKIQKLHIFFSLLIPDMTHEERQLLDEALIKTYAIIKNNQYGNV